MRAYGRMWRGPRGGVPAGPPGSDGGAAAVGGDDGPGGQDRPSGHGIDPDPGGPNSPAQDRVIHARVALVAP